MILSKMDLNFSLSISDGNVQSLFIIQLPFKLKKPVQNELHRSYHY